MAKIANDEFPVHMSQAKISHVTAGVSSRYFFWQEPGHGGRVDVTVQPLYLWTLPDSMGLQVPSARH